MSNLILVAQILVEFIDRRVSRQGLTDLRQEPIACLLNTGARGKGPLKFQKRTKRTLLGGPIWWVRTFAACSYDAEALLVLPEQTSGKSPNPPQLLITFPQ
jgi:hypothetical protein